MRDPTMNEVVNAIQQLNAADHHLGQGLNTVAGVVKENCDDINRLKNQLSEANQKIENLVKAYAELMLICGGSNDSK